MTGSSLLVEPAYLWTPPYTRTLGPEVCDIAAMANYAPDADQEAALNDIFALGPDNKVVAVEAAVIACRQNLKTALFKMCALGWLYVMDQNLITWSAHEFDTAQEAHRDLATLIDDCPALRRRLKAVHYGAADKSIELHTGQRVKFKARTQTGGRGLSGDKMVLDEAFALLAAHMGSLFPTMSAREDPQALYGSSAGQIQSAVLRRIRNRGRKGGDPSLIYREYCDDLPGECEQLDCNHGTEQPGCRLDDESRWARANPAMGRRITVEFIRSERRAMPPAEFARERLGWWDEGPDEEGQWSVIPEPAWLDVQEPLSQSGSQAAFSIDVKPDRSFASIGVASQRADGLLHIELVDRRPGTEWVVDRVADLDLKWNPIAWVVDEGAPAGSLIKDIEQAGVVVVKPTMREIAQAAGQFYDAVVHSKTVRHRGQRELDRAAEGAAKRPLSDAWAWSRKDPSVDVTPLVAVTNALWGLNQHLDGGGLSPDDVYVGKF